MGWRPWELERIEHPRDFLEAIKGYQWRQAWALDLAAFAAFHAYSAAGAKKKDESPLTMEDILGREPFAPLLPPAEMSEADRERQELEDAERVARQERAKLMIWAAQKARVARERGEDPTPWESSPGG